jgi:autotransporter-associated beta strand protein
LGAGIFLQGNGTLMIDTSNAALYTFSDDIADGEGSGGPAPNSWGLTVVGDGTGGVTLAGHNTYTGPTSVNAAALEVDGDIAVSTITVEAQGTLQGVGNAAGGIINNGTVSPHYPQLSTSDYSQGTDGTLFIAADQVGSAQISVSGVAGIDGLLYLELSATPVIGATYTVLTAGTLNGSFARSATFDEQTGHTNSVFGEITYATNTSGTHSALYTVLAIDEIFRDSFEGPNSTYTGACMTKQQFAGIPATVLDNFPICVPPFTVNDASSGTTVVACQTSMCTSTVAGCPTTLHTSPGTLTGTLATSYQIATPLTTDDFSGPLHITGLAGTVDCTATLSGTSAQLNTVYWAGRDYLGDAFIYQLHDATTQNLTTNLSTSGCGFYGYATSFVQPYVIQQMQVQINNIIDGYLPSPDYYAPGVRDTICPAP